MRIFVPIKDRISKRKYFRFVLVEQEIFPTQDVTSIFKKDSTRESIYYLLSFLNLPIVYDWLRLNGIVKGDIVEFSKKPVASIPFRNIDWNNENEVMIHDHITRSTKTYLETKHPAHLKKIRTAFDTLLNTPNKE